MSATTPDSVPYGEHPCLRCGACCAHFRVSFYWADAQSRNTPEALTEQLTPLLACMAGTNRAAPRCVALKGEVGASVCCGIYEQRPSPCRELQSGDDKCNRARANYGLEPLAPTVV
jgi:hypothetical protein